LQPTPLRDIPPLVNAVRQAFDSGITRPIEWRMSQLKAMVKMIQDNEEDIVEALRKDLRRPRNECVIMEVVDIINQCKYLIKHLATFMKPEPVPTLLHQWPMKFERVKQPFGVVCLISPWNFPLGLALIPLAGILAAGNTCVVKPSEISTASCALLSALIPKYLDTFAVKVVVGAVPETTKLLEQRFDHIMYTGGAVAGRIIMAAAAKHLTPVTLELGGKCPAYVDKSANLEVTARRLVNTKLLNSGQICMCPDYVLVHEQVRDELIEHINQQLKRLFPGDNLQHNPDIGRIINKNHVDRLSDMLCEKHGGKVWRGGRVDKDDLFVDFTIILDPSLHSKLMTEEIFGPILPVLQVSGVQEAVKFISDRECPLAAYAFTRDKQVQDSFVLGVSTGSICINDCLFQILSYGTGFGGKGHSGMGSYRGKFAFSNFTHYKPVAIQSPSVDPSVRYPPYTNRNLILLRMLLGGELLPWWNVSSLKVGGVALAAIIASAVLVNQFVKVEVGISLR
ncbi:unnamed protein product, partial [Discosporangium mesarthrocarpum]